MVHPSGRAPLTLILCLCVGLTLMPTPALAQDGTISRVALVVVFPDDTLTTCVDFAMDQVDSVQLLFMAQLDVVYTALPSGAVVCSINGVGCSVPIPIEACMCQCPSSDDCLVWRHWHWRDGTWESYSASTGNVDLVDGDIDCWVWGRDDASPPDLLYEEICLEPTLTPTFLPSRTETPFPSETPLPTETSLPSPTVTDTQMPTETATATDAPTPTATSADTATITPTLTRTHTPDPNVTATRTRTRTRTPTRTETPEGPTPTDTSDGYPGSSGTATATPDGYEPTSYPGPSSATPTRTRTRTPTGTRTRTGTPTRTPLYSPTITATWRYTPTPSGTPTVGPTATVTATPAPDGNAESEASPPPHDGPQGPTLSAQHVEKPVPSQGETPTPGGPIEAAPQAPTEPCIQVLPTPVPTDDRVAMLLSRPTTSPGRTKSPLSRVERRNGGVLWALIAFAVLGVGYAATQRTRER